MGFAAERTAHRLISFYTNDPLTNVIILPELLLFKTTVYANKVSKHDWSLRIGAACF